MVLLKLCIKPYGAFQHNIVRIRDTQYTHALYNIGVWAVRTGSDDDGMTFNNTLVLSFVGQTR